MERVERLIHLAYGQNRLLELIAGGAPLRDSLTLLLRFVEQEAPELLCSILLLDADGLHLRHGAAPSLPPDYCRMIDGSAIGPKAGSCGTAAYLGKQIVVQDIETDPLWADYRHLARPHGLRACWSTPILGPFGKVLGTFAMYFKEPRKPAGIHERLISIATHVAAIAVIKEHRDRALHESEERYRLLNLATNDVVWDLDLEKQTVWWNESVLHLFGYTAAEVGKELSWWSERVHPDDRDRVNHSLHLATATNANSWSADYRFRRKNGTYSDIHDRGYVMRDAEGKTIRMIGVMQDITERKQAQLRIEQLAYYEPVTGLPNRTSMQRTLASAIARASVERSPLSLLLLNLNYFRDINDSLGHRNGDVVLRRLAERLSAAAGRADHVASLGGDEFAVLLSSSVSGEHAVELVKDCLRHPVDVVGVPVTLDAAIGIAVYPRDGLTAEVLWQHADVALRTAKERGDSHLYYDKSIDPYDPARVALVGDLRSALGTNELLLHYQPKVDLKSGRTVGVEALVRWHHPTRGMVSPSTFIPMAERTVLINPLTDWIVDAAVTQAVAFANAGIPLEMSVNLSARNLHDPVFCTHLLSNVRSKGFPLSQLTLELTETAIMSDPGRAKAGLKELREAGIQVSMDDYGVGQSSLRYLKDLPITKIKIDKSFVMGFGEPRNTAIVQSAIDLARHMGLGITAEGVEDDTAYRTLCDLGCDQGQGQFFSWGLPPDALMTWLRESRWRAAEAAPGSRMQ
jgi:diguanylate cyclase (GGDEF)-like protein/PAS domain S-box-containing protein